MILKKLCAVILVLLLLLSVSACDNASETPSETSKDVTTEADPHLNSPHQKLSAYVIGATSLLPSSTVKGPATYFSEEVEFAYDRTDSFTDDSAPQEMTFAENGETRTLTYRFSVESRHAHGIFDVYEYGRSVYTFARADGRLSLVNHSIFEEEKSGDAITTEDSAVAAARELLSQYVSEDLSAYTSEVAVYASDGYDRYFITFTLEVNSVTLSRVRVTLYSSGLADAVDLQLYRGDVDPALIPQDLAETADTRIAERLSEWKTATEASGEAVPDYQYVFSSATLYFDAEGRPYVVYSINVNATALRDKVDFLIYLK